jgi:hypothetical protein
MDEHDDVGLTGRPEAGRMPDGDVVASPQNGGEKEDEEPVPEL